MVNLGIDESNHGRIPEFYVGVNSENVNDILESNIKLEKKRGRITPNEIIGKRDFRFIRIEKDLIDDFGFNGSRIIAYSEFLIAYPHTKTLFIDGEFSDNSISKLEKIVGSIRMPEIEAIPKGDEKILLLNIADGIANFLYRSYQKECFKKYKEKEISIELERYYKHQLLLNP